MNARKFLGLAGSPVFTDAQGQFVYLRRAGNRPGRAGLDRVGNMYLHLQRSANNIYCISAENDAQRPLLCPEAICDPVRLRRQYVCADGIPIMPCEARITLRPSTHGRCCVPRRTEKVASRGARKKLRPAAHRKSYAPRRTENLAPNSRSAFVW